MKLPILLLICLSLLFSCKKEIMEKSIISELEPFNQIEFNNAFEVFITEDSIFSIRIVGDEKAIEDVSFKVENNTLSINNDGKMRWLSPTKNKIFIYIYSQALSKIEAAEGCNIQTLNPITSEEFGLILKGKMNQASLELNSKIFYYWNNFPCGGKLTLWGETEELKIWNFAIISVDAKNLTAKYAIIENSSKGDCEVTVLNKLEYSISGTGNIHLYGSPSEIIVNNLSSSGRLIQH